MRLHLDWDSDALKEMHLPAVRDRQPVGENQRRLAEFVADHEGIENPDTGKWELWTSSNHGHGDSNGWHYVEYDLEGDLETIRRLRTSYGDDKLRISLDGKRIDWGSPFVGVLYHMKEIRPNEHKPYDTDKRARLIERHWPTEDYEDIKNEDGTLNYAKVTELLADHSDFTSRAALYRRIQQRASVTVATEPKKRGYDIAKGRRSPTRAEAKALRDYAEARDLGHYGDGAKGVPEELAAKPTRTTFHEYWEMPEIELNAQDFGEGDTDDESEWFPVNIRTGTYDGVDEVTVKQVHDRVAGKIVDTLSPGFYQDTESGREWVGLDLSRWSRAISLERDRPLDPDEYARYRRVWHENQPGTTIEQVRETVDRRGIEQFGADAVHWEVIVYDGEDALKRDGPTTYWWIARGVLDASNPDAVRNPIKHSAIVADTQGWL